MEAAVLARHLDGLSSCPQSLKHGYENQTTGPIARAIAWDKTFHKMVRKRLGLSKYQYLTLTFAKGLVVGYVLAFLFPHR